MSEDLLGVVEALGAPRLMVLGDVMLDRFTRGAVERVSPEGPALVLRREQEDVQPGGAGRVALFARALGATVSLAGVVGDDEDGRLLCRLLEEAGIDHSDVLACPDRPTTVKERFAGVAGHNQPQLLLRVDHEGRDPVPDLVARRLAERLATRLGACDALLIADHNKGACPPGLLAQVLDVAAGLGVPALVDPARQSDLGRYQGAEALLPNRVEAAAVLGRVPATLEDGERAAREMVERSGAFAVLLKLDRDGLALGLRGLAGRAYPSRARRVCDVTGAGDAVLATAGLCRAVRLGWRTTARLAALAAGLKVERPVAFPVGRHELRAALIAEAGSRSKLVCLEQMTRLAEGYRAMGLSVVLTNGCFDLLHAAHAAYLEEAARLGDVLVVAVNRDESVRRLKGLNRPIVAEMERAALVAALGCVNHVLLFEEETPHEVLRRVRPDVLVKGGDYRPEEVVGREVVESYGGRVCVAGRRPGLSTSRLIEAVVRSRSA
jgi:D-beta-D-heptose 7-phosphate kinase/D-beta-D-heptose 1-phosphate adenosyltransferase